MASKRNTKAVKRGKRVKTLSAKKVSGRKTVDVRGGSLLSNVLRMLEDTNKAIIGNIR